MSGHEPCRCGKPITDGAHLCSACVATLRENLMLQVSEVARMFGIPPHMLMDTEKSETRRRSERRAWAVWDRKRRARRKR